MQPSQQFFFFEAFDFLFSEMRFVMIVTPIMACEEAIYTTAMAQTWLV